MANDFTPKKLVGLDIDNSNKDWYLLGYPVSAPMLVPGAVKNLYNITLALSTPYWIENDLNTDEWTVESSPDTNVLANVGNVPAYPKFTITPKQAKSSNDMKYKEFWAVHWDSGLGFTDKPVDITNSAYDTAALVTASKMQATGADLRVNIDGVNVDYWFGGGGIDSATTAIWVNLTLIAVPDMVLVTSLPNNDTVPASIVVSYDESFSSYATQIPQNRSIQVQSEIISYSTYTIDAASRTVTFIPTERAAKGGAYAAHAPGVAVYCIQHDIWTTHGDATAVAQGDAAPLSPGALEFEKKASQYRGEANTIGILPFSKSAWSA
jgi:hypothetical protein